MTTQEAEVPTSKTKTKAAAIAKVAVDSDTHYLAFDTDGDWVLTFNAISSIDQILIGYSSDKISLTKTLPVEMLTRVLAEEQAAGTGLVRCAALRSYIVCGTLGSKVYKAVNSRAAGVEEMLERTRILVAAAERVADTAGWHHQAFLVPQRKGAAKKPGETTGAKVTIETTAAGVKLARVEALPSAGATAATSAGATSAASCACCGRADPTKQCSRCKTAEYCDANCQKADWNLRHKRACRAPL